MKQTILLIEDNPDIMRLNRSVLGDNGYQVLEAETLEEGQALLKRENPALLVLDILLPDGNGLEYLEKLRKNSNIPVLLLTALKEDEEIVAGLTHGGDDYLPKPYNLDVFLARVTALLRRSRQKAHKDEFQNSFYVFKSGDLHHRVAVKDIISLETAGRKVEITLRDNRKLYWTGKLVELLEELPKGYFVRCHQGFGVNIGTIREITRFWVTAVNGKRIPISRSYLKDVQKAFLPDTQDD